MIFLIPYFGLPTQSLTSHLIFEVLAYFIGFRYYLYLKKSKGDSIDYQNRLMIVIGAAFGALVGSRLLGALENLTLFWEYKTNFMYYYANKTIIGGLLGGLWGVELCKKMIGESQSSGDLFTYPLIVGIAIGRIGCFLAGLSDNTHGSPTDFFLGYDFGDGILRHPIQLYEIAFLFLLLLGLISLSRRVKLASGALFKLFMIFYLTFRFFIEFIKPVYLLPFGLSSIQLACLLGLLYYYRFILMPNKLMTH
jgi:prolipoprotein diacylglyceryltransferase